MTLDSEAFTAPSNRAHKLLQELMGLLDQALPDDSHGQLKALLRERGTSACVFARLGTDERMAEDLRAMHAAASAAESEKGSRLPELRRLIEASLAELRGH